MLRLRAIGFCAVLFLLAGFAGGCVQGDNHVDEEKDPHFQRGRNLASGQDFKGAADEFEKALENNPRSAPAHFELAWIEDTKLNDYAAAIYHYEQHLLLQPDSKHASLIKERIRGCKQELANSVFPLPDSRNLQQEVDRLNATNALLKLQLEDLRKQLAQSEAGANRAAAPRYAEATPRYAEGGAAQAELPRAAASGRRVHIVKSHETISSIAAQYGLKASAVLAANPQTDPRRLRIGQSLYLP